MWDNYYDKVEYSEKEEQLDVAGNIIYKPSRQIMARFVSGGERLIINKDGTSTRYTKEYHIPFMVNEGDKIDGRIVKGIEPSRDIFGRLHFCIVKVE